MPYESILLGITLAAAAGLRAFMPFLFVGGLARYAHVPSPGMLEWTASDAGFLLLLVATLLEVLGDKIPVVDHVLDAGATFLKPVAGMLLPLALLYHASPMAAWVLGIVAGAPLALGVHVTKAGTRAASSATTMGVGNPLLSLLEDVLAVILLLLAALAPFIALALVIVLVVLVLRAWRVMRQKLGSKHMRTLTVITLLLLAAGRVEAQSPRTIVAVFAHADDERAAGPILARYAREGAKVHLVIATDGRKGAAAHATIPLGDSLATVRMGEARCAARELGIEPPILLGHADAGLASFAALDSVRRDLRRIFAELKPDAIVTFGPEGGTGHPDHRLVGAAVTDVVQSGAPGATAALYYPALPAERMATAPPAKPAVNSVESKYLTVRVAFTERDFEATTRAYACHASQYTLEQVNANMAYMKHGWNGQVWLRRWNDTTPRTSL